MQLESVHARKIFHVTWWKFHWIVTDLRNGCEWYDRLFTLAHERRGEFPVISSPPPNLAHTHPPISSKTRRITGPHAKQDTTQNTHVQASVGARQVGRVSRSQSGLCCYFKTFSAAWPCHSPSSSVWMLNTCRVGVWTALVQIEAQVCEFQREIHTLTPSSVHMGIHTLAFPGCICGHDSTRKRLNNGEMKDKIKKQHKREPILSFI